MDADGFEQRDMVRGLALGEARLILSCISLLLWFQASIAAGTRIFMHRSSGGVDLCQIWVILCCKTSSVLVSRCGPCCAAVARRKTLLNGSLSLVEGGAEPEECHVLKDGRGSAYR